MKLRDRLADLDDGMFARLRVMEAEAKKLLEYSQGGAHITFTPHGLSHITAVEKAYDWLLSDADVEGFNAAEILCLLAATFFHDSLMIPRKLGQESVSREQHARRAIDFLINNRERLSLGIHEADVVSSVIRGHAVSSLNEIDDSVVLGNLKVEIRKLAACLSMADICHADESRAPEIVFKYFDMDEDSAYHWRRHMQLSGITRDREVLLVSALAFTDDGEQSVVEYKESIINQLRIVAPYFSDKLAPLRTVELKTRRLETPLDRPMRFRPDMAAILDILVEGVYQRDDVFVRELLQNSLDACYLRRAVAMRRGEGYNPQIVITAYRDRKQLRAVRVDDNGIGMDVNDIEDTVLWLGRTSADRDNVKALLETTSQKNLIATFGIGLLSCFKCAKQVIIRSCKEGRPSLECSMEDIVGTIRPKESSDTSPGTSIFVILAESAESGIDVDAAIKHYARYIDQADLILQTMEWDSKTLNFKRDEVFNAGRAQGQVVGVMDKPGGWLTCEIRGDEYRGTLSISQAPNHSDSDDPGTLLILNEGIFVCEAPADKWLPSFAKSCSGYINFAAKAVDLSASRDNVIQNARLDERKTELATKSMVLIRDLVERSNGADRKTAAVLLAIAFDQASEHWKERILRELDDFQVAPFKSRKTISLRTLRETRPTVIYLEYESGRWVNELVRFDEKQLYHKPDDIIELQASLLNQEGKPVLHTDRSDGNDKMVLEATLLKAYFSKCGISARDLKDETIIEGHFRSKPVPSSIRRRIGSNIKFVEIIELPNKRAWKVGQETWFNLANPSMERLYNALQDDTLGAEHQTLARALIAVLSHRFDEAVDLMVDVVTGRYLEVESFPAEL